MSHPAPPASRSRRLALAAACAAMLMVILDGSIVTVALPVIQRGLRFSPANLTWVVNAYLIAFGGLLLLARPARRPGRPQAHVHRRPGPVHRRVAAVRGLHRPANADRRAVRSGHRRGGGLGGEPGHDRHAVP